MMFHVFTAFLVACTTALSLFSPLFTAFLATTATLSLFCSASSATVVYPFTYWSQRLQHVPEQLLGTWKAQGGYFPRGNRVTQDLFNSKDSFFTVNLTQDGQLYEEFRQIRKYGDNETYWNVTSPSAKWEVHELVYGSVLWVKDLAHEMAGSPRHFGMTYFQDRAIQGAGSKIQCNRMDLGREVKSMDKEQLTPLERYQERSEHADGLSLTCPLYYASPNLEGMHEAVIWARRKTNTPVYGAYKDDSVLIAYFRNGDRPGCC